MNDKELLSKLIELRTKPNYKALEEIGCKMFDFFSSQGFPAEMFFDKLKEEGYNKEELAIVVSKYLNLLTEHRIKSSGDFMGKQHLKTIENNKKIIKRVLLEGAFG